MAKDPNFRLIIFTIFVTIVSVVYILYLHSKGGASYIVSVGLNEFGKSLGSFGFFTMWFVYSRSVMKLIVQKGSIVQRLNPVGERPAFASDLWDVLNILNKAHPYLGLSSIALIYLHGYLVLPFLNNLPLLLVLALLAWQGFFGILLKLKFTPAFLKSRSYLIHTQFYTAAMILILAVLGHTLWQ